MKFLLLAAVTVVVVVARPPSSNDDAGGQFRLVKTSETDPGNWLDENGVNALVANNINFIDVTDLVEPGTRQATAGTKAIPSGPQYQSVVQAVLPRLEVARIESFIQSYSSFYNRYYTSDTGVEAAEFIRSQVNQIISASPSYQGNVSVARYEHTPTWRQPSIIARIEGANPSLKGQVVILGAHEDSILSGNPTGNSPGADDNASGSSVLLETFRALIVSGFVPRRSIEFQWYAAEEVGLRGSGAIASAYYSSGVDVVSMLNFDVVGYYVQGVTGINLISDNTNSQLNAFLRTLITEYCDVAGGSYTCGYGCSDHASFNRYGIPAASPCEPRLHPEMHTTRDTINRVSFTQILQFVKLAVGYAIEVAQPL